MQQYQLWDCIIVVSFVQFVFVWIPVPGCWLYLDDGAAVEQRPTGGVRRLSLCYANLCHIFLGFLRASISTAGFHPLPFDFHIIHILEGTENSIS